MIWAYLTEGPWIVFCIYWLAGALMTRRTVSQESDASRYGVLAMELLGYVLLFSGAADKGVLGRLVVHRSYALEIAGVAFTWIGLAIALWARWYLGRYWSARITLKEDHKLIRSGPYAHFRHPIYSGLDLAAIGGVLVIDKWRCVAGVALIVAGYLIKARKEESVLAAQFGNEFEEHRQHTGFLIPRIR